jgi:enoyl-CoA hydratase/carnithine racemase
MTTTFNSIRYEVADRVLTITFTRAAQRNTVTYEVLDEMIEAVTRADADESVRAVIVTGEGDFFSAGTDLSTGGGGYEADAADFKPLRGRNRDVGGELSLKIFSCTKPVIAAINGTAVGIGVSMILPMDIRIAADTARFGLPFVRRGIVPESCATWFLPRIVGIATAVDWAVTGRVFPASEALAAGLVRELVPAADVLTRANEVAADIAANTSAVSVALTRQMLWRQLGSPHPMSANRLETLALKALGRSADVAEGIASFKEKRAPQFPSTTRDLPDFYPWWQEEPFDA